MIPDNDTLSTRTTVILFALIIVVIIGASILVLAARPQPVVITIQPPPPTSIPLPEGTPAPITVYVTGKVGLPGTLLTLAAGSRVTDAIAAAGGTTTEADLSRVNLAAVLRDGDQVHVPGFNESTENGTLPTITGGGMIAINSATLEELEALPGIGPALAAAIIEHRERVGRFESQDDLDEVRGIGPALIEQIVPWIIFD